MDPSRPGDGVRQALQGYNGDPVRSTSNPRGGKRDLTCLALIWSETFEMTGPMRSLMPSVAFWPSHHW